MAPKAIEVFSLKFPDIVFQVPETLGANGILGWYGKLMNMNQPAMEEGMHHRFLMVMPRPLSVDRHLWISGEIKQFEVWCEDRFNVCPYIDII